MRFKIIIKIFRLNKLSIAYPILLFIISLFSFSVYAQNKDNFKPTTQDHTPAQSTASSTSKSTSKTTSATKLDKNEKKNGNKKKKEQLKTKSSQTLSPSLDKIDKLSLQKNLEKRPILEKEYIQKLMQRAETHYFKEKYNIALKLFQVVIEKDPENIAAYRYAGDIFLIQKKLQKAREHFIIAVELSSEPQTEWLRLGQVYILEKKSKMALLALNKALEIQNDLYLCHFYLGLVYYNLLQDKQRTIKHWDIYKNNVDAEEKTKISKALSILRQKNFSFKRKTKVL